MKAAALERVQQNSNTKCMLCRGHIFTHACSRVYSRQLETDMVNLYEHTPPDTARPWALQAIFIVMDARERLMKGL